MRQACRFRSMLLASLALAFWVLPVLAQPTGGTLRTVLMDYNTIAAHAVVTGVAGQAVRVYQVTLFCNGANGVTFKDSTPATLHPLMNFSASQGMVWDYKQNLPWLTTALGKDLVLDLNAAQQCVGILWYTQGSG